MNYYLTLFFLIVFVLSGQTQKEKKLELFMNTYELFKDSIWISKTEVSNQEFSIYIKEAVVGKTEAEASLLKPNRFLWKSIDGRPKPYEDYYFGHPAYDNYPVVNITREQAIQFCEWKTDKLNATLQSIAGKDKKKLKKVRVRLPKDKEWKFAALGGLPGYSDYPWKGLGMRIEKGKDLGLFRANFMDNRGEIRVGKNKINASEELTSPVNSFYENGYGIYNMSGNVSELIEDKYIIRGGHWNSFKDDLRLKSFEYYTGASPTLGFRYIIEVDN